MTSHTEVNLTSSESVSTALMALPLLKGKQYTEH